MSYWPSLLKESWRDTWDLVVGKSLGTTLVAGFLIFSLTLTIHWVRKDHHDFWAKIKSVVVALIATIGAFLIIFLCHALLLTPKKILTRYQTEAVKVQKELATRREGTEDENKPTTPAPFGPSYQLEALATPRTVRTEFERTIDGRVTKPKPGTENPLSGATFTIIQRRVIECRIIEVAKGIPTKLRRSFIESTNKAVIVLRTGEKQSYDQNDIEHGKIITEEIVRNDATEQRWNRNLDNGSGSAEENRWLDSLPVPEEWEDTFPWGNESEILGWWGLRPQRTRQSGLTLGERG